MSDETDDRFPSSVWLDQSGRPTTPGVGARRYVLADGPPHEAEPVAWAVVSRYHDPLFARPVVEWLSTDRQVCDARLDEWPTREHETLELVPLYTREDTP